jgi:RHS repeat-associated protein
MRPKEIQYPGGSKTQYSYTGATTKTSVIDALGTRTSEQTVDASGKVTSAKDEGGTISYAYHANGKPRQITAAGATTTMLYDALGNPRTLTEPNAGATTYKYNPLGELLVQQTARQLAAGATYSTTLSYDVLGRVTKNDNPEEGAVSYHYDSDASGKTAKGMLGKAVGYGVTTNYSYDDYYRLKTKAEEIDGESFAFRYEYNPLSQVSKEIYPSGYVADYSYTNQGYLANITHNGNPLWRCNTMNERGQITKYQLSGIEATNQYSPLGFLQKQGADWNGTALITPHTYTFEPTTGNLMARQGHSGMREDFAYDNLDRLIRAWHSDPISQKSIIDMTADYAPNGNLTTKQDMGNYTYGSTQPHAVVGIKNYVGINPAYKQDITYTSFNKVKSIVEGRPNYLNISTYGPDQERRKMYTYTGNKATTKYYIGNYEKIVSPSETRELHYVGNNVVHVKTTAGGGTSEQTYFLLKDHLGSLTTVIGTGGTVVAKYSYDVWGRRRSYNDLSYTLDENDALNKNYFDRFYTMHEQLPHMGVQEGAGLINMNGRMYDPLLGRMLSPDNYVQSPGFTQSYNRYSYCMNNPLKYTDPTGNEFVNYGFSNVSFAQMYPQCSFSSFEGMIGGYDNLMQAMFPGLSELGVQDQSALYDNTTTGQYEHGYWEKQDGGSTPGGWDPEIGAMTLGTAIIRPDKWVANNNSPAMNMLPQGGGGSAMNTGGGYHSNSTGFEGFNGSGTFHGE